MLRPFDILNDAPNNSFNRSANSAAIIRKVEGLIHCAEVHVQRRNERIYFAAWNRDDFLMGGSNEYFVYAEAAPAEEQYIVQSLDELRQQTDAQAFRKIADF
jgi:hypothetical protein